MKTSEIEAAAELRRIRRFYREMGNLLSDYPGYDAALDVNGKRLMISRTQAMAILDDYVEVNEKKMADLGLEWDE